MLTRLRFLWCKRFHKLTPGSGAAIGGTGPGWHRWWSRSEWHCYECGREFEREKWGYGPITFWTRWRCIRWPAGWGTGNTGQTA